MTLKRDCMTRSLRRFQEQECDIAHTSTAALHIFTPATARTCESATRWRHHLGSRDNDSNKVTSLDSKSIRAPVRRFESGSNRLASNR